MRGKWKKAGTFRRFSPNILRDTLLPFLTYIPSNIETGHSLALL